MTAIPSSREHTAHHTARTRPVCANAPARIPAAPAPACLAAAPSYPQIAAARAAGLAVIERGHLPGVPVSAHLSVPVAHLHPFLIDAQRTGAELDAVWQVLIERGRRDADWQLVALAVAAPRLAQVAARAAGRAHIEAREEIAAAVLGAFTEALLTLAPDLHRGLIVHQLLRRAQAAAQKVVDRRKAACRRSAPGHEQAESLPQPGAAGRAPNHPDIALARLVERQVITREEAELIGRHRIEHVTLRQLGAERGWYPMQTTRALRAAERKVAAALGHLMPAPARRAPNVPAAE